MNDQKLRLVEELGVLHEKAGLQPAAARIMALLMVSDRIELSFEEIYETLHISKSAASNSLNFLLSTDRIEYITQPGERKRYFRCKLKSVKDGIERSLTGMNAFNVMFKKILEQRPENTKEFNSSLREVTEFIDFVKDELPILFEKWKKRS